MALITIDNVDAPAPTAYSVELADIDGSGSTRSDAAILHREILRQGAAKLSVQWRLPQSELTTLSAALESPQMSVTFFAPVSGMYKTADMYCSTRKMALVHDEAGDSYWDLSANLVEY